VWRPQTVELVAALRDAGWNVLGSPLSVEETVKALAATPGLVEGLRRAATTPDREGDGRRAAPARNGAAAARRDSDGVGRPRTLLSVRDLTYCYPDGPRRVDALTGVSLSLERGDFLAIAGANGAGKSTLASLLTGVLEAPRGTVFLDGEDISAMAASNLSDRVGYVFQNPEHQFVSGTVLGELAFSLSPKAGRKGARHLTPEQRERAEVWLDRLGLLPLAEANPFSLSQGQKRRLGVAAMLIRGQSALFLDEPTLGQDELQSSRLMAMMQEFRADGGTVAMITHDMRLVSEYADSLLVLAAGRSVYWGDPAGFFSRPELVKAAGLSVPALGRVCTGLRDLAGTPDGLLTVRAFLEVLGR
jgi:energy-coupling factor transporter ATP-binding protein EcfA2